MKKTIIFAILIALFIGCQTEKSKQYQRQQQNKEQEYSDRLDNLKYGQFFNPPLYSKCSITESNKNFIKYRIFDPRLGYQDYFYITVIKDTIVAVWKGQY